MVNDQFFEQVRTDVVYRDNIRHMVHAFEEQASERNKKKAFLRFYGEDMKSDMGPPTLLGR